jgi:hypothetical protein
LTLIVEILVKSAGQENTTTFDGVQLAQNLDNIIGFLENKGKDGDNLSNRKE